VSIFVDDATLLAARERASAGALTSGEVAQWQQVADYATARPPDPLGARAVVLRELLSRPAGMPDDQVLAETGRLLSREVNSGADGLAGEVLRRCVRWFDEDVAAAAPLLELFTGHHRDPAGGSPAVDPLLVQRLAAWLAARGLTLESATVISGGFSRLMLDVRWSGGRGVVRIEQDGMFATEGAREVAVMRALRAHGYPVPEVLWPEPDAGVLGAPFFVMAFVDGAPRVDDAGLDDVLRSAAQLHALDPSAAREVAAIDGLAPDVSAEQRIEAQLVHWRAVYRAAWPGAIPLLERGFAWLRANLRPTGPSVVVHGDPGPGNALHDGRGVAAVIDWEFAHAGDAAEDWAYLALIRGRRLMTPEQWKVRLASVVGVEYDPTTWQAWEAYNGVKGACVNLTALDVFCRSPRPTPDHLAIGVAVHLRFLGRVVDLTGARG
jgi:aminoglycoside phosphotransferase (APT) family kinase protein